MRLCPPPLVLKNEASSPWLAKLFGVPFESIVIVVTSSGESGPTSTYLQLLLQHRQVAGDVDVRACVRACVRTAPVVQGVCMQAINLKTPRSPHSVLVESPLFFYPSSPSLDHLEVREEID